MADNCLSHSATNFSTFTYSMPWSVTIKSWGHVFIKTIISQGKEERENPNRLCASYQSFNIHEASRAHSYRNSRVLLVKSNFFSRIDWRQKDHIEHQTVLLTLVTFLWIIPPHDNMSHVYKALQLMTAGHMVKSNLNTCRLPTCYILKQSETSWKGFQ